MSKKIQPSVLVQGAQKMLDEHWGYIWGASGGIWTQADQDKVNADPDGRAQTKKYGQQWVGKHVIDCSGVPYYIAKQNGITIAHGSNTQYNKYCYLKGEITSGTNLKPGAGVFKYSEAYENPFYHVGIYIGNNKVIEAQGTYRGVVESSLFGWSHYGYWKFVEWGEIENTTGGTQMETLRKGSKGPAVSALQEMLNKLGYNAGTVDGIYGSKTMAAVRSFQAEHALTVDGIAGEITLTSLAVAAAAVPSTNETTETTQTGSDATVSLVLPKSLFITLKDIINSI